MVEQVISQFSRTLRRAAAVQEKDSQLLARFAAGQDEVAFEALVRRHGPLVWGVCQRVLYHHQDAEDAFQATFLVLAKKADLLRRPEQLANWLFGTARRTAINLRRKRDRRSRLETTAADAALANAPSSSAAEPLRTVVDEELARLPSRYRLPIVLCCLEGQTQAEVGRRLDWPTGTVAGRLSRGRELLRNRLRRRGIDVPAAALAAALTAKAEAELPVALPAVTAQAALAFLGLGGAISASVRAAAESALREYATARLGMWLAGAAGACLCLAGAGWLGSRLIAAPPEPRMPPALAPALAPAAPLDAPAPEVVSGLGDRFIELPADGAVVVALLESVDPATDEVKSRVAIRADGRVTAEEADAATLEARLAPSELQALLQCIVHDQDFFGFDAAKVERGLRGKYLPEDRVSPGDTLITRIRVRTAEAERTSQWRSLGSTALLYADEEPIVQLHRVEKRLRNVALVQSVGGTARVQELAEWLNRRLKATYPNLAPFAATDLTGIRPSPDGSPPRLSFVLGDKPRAGYFAATIAAPEGGSPTLVQVTPSLRPDHDAPKAVRRMCAGPAGGEPDDP